MPKPFKQWTVLPHGKLSRLDDNLLSVTGQLHMPIGSVPRGALRTQLEAWARIPDLNRIIVSHGEIVTRDPAGVLNHLAEALAA